LNAPCNSECQSSLINLTSHLLHGTRKETTEAIKTHFKLTIQTPETHTEQNNPKHLQWFQSTNHMKRQILQNWFSNKMTDELM